MPVSLGAPDDVVLRFVLAGEDGPRSGAGYGAGSLEQPVGVAADSWES